MNHATHGSSNLFCLVTALAGLADIFLLSCREQQKKKEPRSIRAAKRRSKSEVIKGKGRIFFASSSINQAQENYAPKNEPRKKIEKKKISRKVMSS